MRTNRLGWCLWTLIMLFGWSLELSAQTPQNRIRLSITPNAQDVKLTFRLADGVQALSVDFGEGEGTTSFAYKPTGDYGMTAIYSFKQVKAEEREIVINADDLIALRILSATKQVNGIREVIAPKLEHLFADNTSLESHSTLDLSKAPRIKAISMTYTGLEHVVLPQHNEITSIVVSPTIAEKTYLKTINIDNAPKLTQLSIGNHQLERDTLDLRKSKQLKILNVTAGIDKKDFKRSKLRAILGIKDMQLDRFLGKNNELGFDQLPDRPEEVPLEQHLYGNQRNYKLNERYIKGLTINLNHLYKARGIQTAISLSNFEWMYQDGEKNGKPNYVALPKDKVSVHDGAVFTFDESILQEGKCKVYFRMSNDGYPGIGRYDAKTKSYNNKLVSYVMTLEKEKPQSLTLQTNLLSSKSINLRLASVDGRAKIKIGEQVIERTDLSTKVDKATPLTIVLKSDKPTITIEGALTMLDCSGSSIAAIDLGQARSLQLLECSRNELKDLDVSACSELVYLYAMENALTAVTLGNLPLLQELNLSFNALTQVDFAGLPMLNSVSVDKNKIGQLNLSSNTRLSKLYCKKNNLSALDLNGLASLVMLSCESNKLTSLDLTKAPLLEALFCKDNALTSLDLSRTHLLKEINVASNKLQTLSTEALTELTELYCWSNQIARLDLSRNKQLKVLSAGDNQLTEVKLEQLPALESLSLGINQIESLSVAGCTALMSMDIFLNKISLSGVETFVESLPMRTEEENGVVIYHNKAEFPDQVEHNQITPEHASKAREKHWIMFDGETPLPLGLDDVVDTSLVVYPTVITGEMQIRGAYATALIYTLDGRLVHRLGRELSSWDASILPNGLYILNFILDDGTRKSYRIEIRK